MNELFKKILGDKKEWKALEDRAKTLPSDYLIVYKEIQQYIWVSSSVSSLDVFRNLLDFFEEAASSGKKVLEVTGKDVAAFCDDILQNEKREITYVDKWREDLNRDIARKLGQ